MTTPTAARDRTRATGADLRAALLSASTWLLANAERINALNVFPVPDWRHGTNMSMTLQRGDRGAAAAGRRRIASARWRARSMKRRCWGPRQLGRHPFAVAARLCAGAGRRDRADARRCSPTRCVRPAKSLIEGVSRPVEGTILTVAREAGEAATGRRRRERRPAGPARGRSRAQRATPSPRPRSQLEVAA